MSQQELAVASSVSARSISDYELQKGAPNLEQLIKLADALEISIGWLLGETEGTIPPGIELKDAPLPGRESVRLALRSIQHHAASLVDQIGYYEREICDRGSYSDLPSAAPGTMEERKFIQRAAEDLAAGVRADMRPSPEPERPGGPARGPEGHTRAGAGRERKRGEG